MLRVVSRRSFSSITSAVAQLNQLPELKQAADSIPHGQAINSDHSGDVVCAKAIANLSRVKDIVSTLPYPYPLAYVSVAAPIYESCGSLTAAYDLFNHSKQVLKDGTDGDDASTLSVRAEGCLAHSRAALSAPATTTNSAQVGYAAASTGAGLWNKVKADSAEFWSPPSPSNVLASLDFVPLKHSLARLNSIAALTHPLAGSAADSEEHKAIALDHEARINTLVKHLEITADILAQQNKSFDVNAARAIALLRLMVLTLQIYTQRNRAATCLTTVAPFSADEHRTQSAISAAATAAESAVQLADKALHSADALKFDDAPEWMRGLLHRLRVDATKHRAAILASQAETTMLAALWALWKEKGKGTASSSVVFPLQPADQAAIQPVIANVGNLSNSSLKAFETIEADSTMNNSHGFDFGIDLGGEMTRPLRMISLLQFMAEKPVMSEGLLRGALDYYNRRRLRSADGRHLHGLQGLDSSSWDVRSISYPATLQLSVAAHLRVYSTLLSQWERREREAAAFGDTADRIFARALKPLGVQYRQQPAPSQQQALLEALLYSSTFSTAHFGSVSCLAFKHTQQLTEYLQQCFKKNSKRD